LRHGVPAEALEGRGEAAFLSPSLLGGPQDHRRGVDQEVEELEAEHGRRHRRKLAWRTPLRMTAVQPDRLLDDGDVVERCGVTLQTIVCPGHTPANTVYWHEPSGTLFSGDHILSRVTPNPGIHFPDGASRMRSLPAYVRSLQRVRSLPAREVLPGHGEEMSDLPGAIERLLAHHEHRAGRIEAMLLERPHTAYEVMLRIFPRVGPERLRQAMAEIVGHLDLLVEQGVAVELDDGGVVHYRGHSRRPIADLRGTAT
ncbi:MAG TPA: MBL fold metallo-hydrolase, partial [Dehalococcoidia bacterium]|nr:MBL fold metallo-hydrolase [Dehalococcoidia bacterium]